MVATFFVTGENAENYPDIIRREQDEGHLIGNHTYSHIQLTSRNRETFREELVQTNEILEEIKQQLAFIQFGSLEIQVHNGQVVQIERREKKRWEKGVNTK